jgi:S-formylglutathione hydrolase FrmB
VLAYPPSVAAGASLPVCLVLHGYGDDERGAFDRLGYHRLLAATRLQLVLASVAGGNGYWHPHPSDDPLRMLLEEFPPVLAGHGLATETFAVLGWSMGGFGALLAASEAPGRFVAVVANSPAFWPSYDEARRVNAGAFDSPEQWRRYGDMAGVLGRLPARLTAPSTLRIDCGESDSFYPAIRELLPNAGVVHLAPGCHDAAFWRSVAAPQLTLIGRAMG